LELGIEPVDLALEPLALGVDDGEPLAARPLALAGRAQVCAEVEQVVLDPAEHRVDLRIRAGVEAREADHGVELVDGAVRRDAHMVFAPPLAAAERGRAVVAGARVDAVQDDHDPARISPKLNDPAPIWRPLRSGWRSPAAARASASAAATCAASRPASCS